MNDIDPDGEVLVAVGAIFTTSRGASVTVQTDGSFEYSPLGITAFQALRAGDVLTDSFAYQAKDPAGLIGPATVTLGDARLIITVSNPDLTGHGIRSAMLNGKPLQPGSDGLTVALTEGSHILQVVLGNSRAV